MNSENIFIFVEYQGITKLLKISEQVLDRNSLEDAIRTLFPNVEQFNYFVQGAQIPKNWIVEFLISKKSAMFLLSIQEQYVNEITFVESDNSSIGSGSLDISSSALKKFFEKDNKSKVVLAVGDLDITSYRTKIIKYSSEFLRQVRGDRPKHCEKSALIYAMFSLFPKLGELTHDVLLKSISEKFRNDRRYERKIRNKKVQIEIVNNIEKTISMIKFLKECHINGDADEIEMFLKETVSYRFKEMMENKDLDIKSEYKIFMEEPIYILKDFEHRFGKAVAKRFTDKIEKLLLSSYVLYTEQLHKEPPRTDWPETINQLLCMFHYLKTPPRRQQDGYSCLSMLSKFIVFCQFDEEYVNEDEEPILVAFGTSEDNLVGFQIHFQCTFFDLPVGTELIDAMDYLNKTFFIFNLKFPHALREYYNYIFLKVYEIEGALDIKQHDLKLASTKSQEFYVKVSKLFRDV